MNTSRSFKAPQVAVGAIVIKDEKILLVKRNKAPHKDLWAIPGGSLELGETLQKAAEREVREETGLTIKAGKPVYTFDLIERDKDGRIRFHYVIVDLEAEYINGELRPADDARDARWFARKDLKRIAMSESTRKLLHKIGFARSS
ncbi:MAG: NUDIX hydrolase [Candidatus Aminicenantes bacterium]